MAKVPTQQLDDGYEEWEYSLEGIHYNFSGSYYFLTPEQEVLFFHALSKLPKEIIDFAQDIYFTSINSKCFAETFTLKKSFLELLKMRQPPSRLPGMNLAVEDC